MVMVRCLRADRAATSDHCVAGAADALRVLRSGHVLSTRRWQHL